jgi:hypothetical protein
VKWQVRFGNLKVFRRTGDEGDKVAANTGEFSDHSTQPLTGTAVNFKPNKTILFGHVRYINPNNQFPEIRLRFTPAQGHVFGPRDADPLVKDDVYGGYTAAPSPSGGFPGKWDRYWIAADGSKTPDTQPVTAPGDIFQGQAVGNAKLSDGYFDDTGDGIVEVSLTVNGVKRTAHGRITTAMPDFAPDSYHVRTIADDLEQMTLGPTVTTPANAQEQAQLKAEVEDTLRRALETVRLMNTMVQNGDQFVRPALLKSSTTGGEASTLSDTSQTWTDNQWVGDDGAPVNNVVITSGNGKDQVRTIVANTQNQLIVVPPWDQRGTPLRLPDAGSDYEIVRQIAGVARISNTMAGQQGRSRRYVEPFFETGMSAEYATALQLHKDVLKGALDTENPADSYFSPFDIMRPPEETANLEDAARQRMPAMMRGSDGFEMALTRRQLAKLAIAESGSSPPPLTPGPLEAAELATAYEGALPHIEPEAVGRIVPTKKRNI